MRETSLASTILTSMMDGVITLDPRGVITGVNPAAAEILGLDSQEALGQSYAQVFFSHAENDDFNQLLLDLVGSSEEKAYAEVRFTRGDGQARHLAVTATLLLDKARADERLGAILVFKDITSVHALRKQRDELSSELSEKHIELSKAYMDLESQNRNLKEARKRFFWVRILALVLGLLFFAGLIGWNQFSRLESFFQTATKESEAEATHFRQAKATRGDIAVTVPCRGFIEPLQLYNVSAETSGKVLARPVEMGQKVKKGQILIRLDDIEVLPKVRQAEAALLKAKQNLREVENWEKRPEYLQAVRAVELARLDLERKKNQLEESQRLFKAGIIPKDDLISANNDFRRSQADMASAEERLGVSREKGSKEKMMVARLELQNAEAAYGEINQKLASTVIKAPANGVVMPPTGDGKTGKQGRFPELGDKVGEGHALMVIGSEAPLGVRAKVDEVDIEKVRVGQEARVGSQAISGTLKGVVRSVAPQAQKGEHQPVFPVIIKLDAIKGGKAGALRLGMSAMVNIVVKRADNTVLVPILTVDSRQGRTGVRVMENGAIVWREVKTGVSDKNMLQITDGLKEGETVYY